MLRPFHWFPVLGVLLLSACGGGEAQDDPPAETRDPAGTAAPEAPAILGPEACRNVGYLCRGLAERSEPRILRWESGTPEIRIRIPPPPLDDRNLARSLQDAAARGILAWQNKPFSLRVDRTGRDGSADFTVRWAEGMNGAELGRAETEWTRSGDGRMGMRVRDFVLSFRNPFDRSRLLSPDQLQLVAAHEMGHALGLPHSDSDRDVMYPTNTATSLSARDYETMLALYALENGALLGAEALEASR